MPRGLHRGLTGASSPSPSPVAAPAPRCSGGAHCGLPASSTAVTSGRWPVVTAAAMAPRSRARPGEGLRGCSLCAVAGQGLPSPRALRSLGDGAWGCCACREPLWLALSSALCALDLEPHWGFSSRAGFSSGRAVLSPEEKSIPSNVEADKSSTVKGRPH
jgi:hypothetical protein